MSQVFPPGANWLVKWSFWGIALGVVTVVGLASALYWGPPVTLRNFSRQQEIPFSHQRHVQGNGIDCRYCHTTVETSAFAGIPATEVCMTCHSQIFTDQEMLAPILESWNTGVPMVWTRVYDLPDFVYFDHSIHVSKGMGCSTCHSNSRYRLEEMRLTAKAQTLHMRWCLGCHRAPEKFIRPRSEVFNMAWDPSEVESFDQKVDGPKLVSEYGIEVGQLTNCSICHR